MDHHPLTELRLHELFNALDGECQALQDALAFWRRGELVEAVSQSAGYFRGRMAACGAALPYDDAARQTAENALAGRITVVHIPHAFADGRIDWRFDPTGLPGRPQDYEWVWQLNRMNFWPAMAAAYANTGDERYPAAFAEHLRSWVESWEIPADSGNHPHSGWRTIECGLRLMSNWPKTMAIMARSQYVTDKDILLYLWSSLRQMRHLLVHNRPGSNWLTMEMNGIYTFAASFPEIRECTEARRISMGLMYADMKRQLLPDGGQWELTPDYHLLSINCAVSLVRSAYRLGFQNEVPRDYLALIEKGYVYLVNIMRPTRRLPQPNDSGNSEDVLAACRKVREVFPDSRVVQWCAAGADAADATRPPYTSLLLPWSGYCVMRENWTVDAAYCLFDVGLLGYGHFHQDKLNLAISYLGEELLFDDGGGNYECSGIRSYACSAWGHSVIAVDGLGQCRDGHTERMRLGTPARAVFETAPDLDYAEAVYDQGFGQDKIPLAVHRRQVLFVKPDIFLVCDRVMPRDDQEHRYEARWQVDSQTMRELLSGVYKSERRARAELVVAPLLQDGVSCSWRSCAVGEGDSGKAGLYVCLDPRPYRPAATVSHVRQGLGEQVFLTLLYPVAAACAEPIEKIARISADCVRVMLSDGRRLEVILAERPVVKWS